MREITNHIEIKLDYSPNSENPSRLFKSFAEVIDATSKIDSIFSKSVNSNYSQKLILEDIEKGSIVTKLIDWIKINPSNQIDDIQSDENIKNYIQNSREKTYKFIEDKKDSPEDIQELKNDLESIAEENQVRGSFNYQPPNLIELAETINKISKATNELNDEESYQIKVEEGEPIKIKSDSKQINIDDVENILADNTLENESILFYKIKKPDFLSESQWEFKYGSKTIKAKIFDSEWLKKFQSGSVEVRPGYSLKVKAKSITKYDKNNKLISEKFEIIEILDVIKNG
ncbi:hypothetical protein EI427_12840 [Flammeovirga pectinis]|uniref:Uncharacterized protein n=1 Tax=Flammeovirga pectinis TaxID=2494373 RepID=A0A3Q9FRW7_9BACT|nr:hypothetical protein [Flammeovirga pectinis]AZQ63091.1 hypothetical protein EI427_12840 [Flammeovirga pectinis]